MRLRIFATTGVTAAFLVASGAAWSETIATVADRTGPPLPGRYDGQLCVSTAGAAMSCGAAQLHFQRGAVRVQVSDIVYRLKLRSSQTDVILLHGTTQIDQFIADYGWAPRTLSFGDSDKNVRYEVRWESRQRR